MQGAENEILPCKVAAVAENSVAKMLKTSFASLDL